LILIIQKDIYKWDYYNPKDGSVVNFDSTKCQTTTYFGHLGPVLTITGDKTKQVRGGTGIFTGRLPFVWIGNQVVVQMVFLPSSGSKFQISTGLENKFRIRSKFDSNYIVTGDASFNKDLNGFKFKVGLKTNKPISWCW
jgi:hypothetical protein